MARSPTVSVSIDRPGSRGINLEGGEILDPSYALIARDVYINTDGQIQVRGAQNELVTTAFSGGTPVIRGLFIYRRKDGTHTPICAWSGSSSGSGISESLSDPDNNRIEGSLNAQHYWFQNFNDKCIAFHNGAKPAVYTGSGTFAVVSESSGTAPTVANAVGLCAYGRVWGLDSDKQTIKFSQLGDETHWATGAGEINMTRIWTQGMDEVTAIVAFNGALVVFGLNHIVFWVDGSGDQLGLNPDNMYVSDVIEGTGCRNQETIQFLGDADLIFLSSAGLQLLSRVLGRTPDSPLNTLTALIASDFDSFASGVPPTAVGNISSALDPEHGMYFLSTGGTSSLSGVAQIVVLHYTRPFVNEDTGQTLFPITYWGPGDAGSGELELVKAMMWDSNGDRLLLAGNAHVNELLWDTITGAEDFPIAAFQSGWWNFGEQISSNKKIMKRILFNFTINNIITEAILDIDYAYNFSTNTVSHSAVTFTREAGNFARKALRMTGSGQYFQLQIASNASNYNDNAWALKNVSIQFKIGAIE